MDLQQVKRPIFHFMRHQIFSADCRQISSTPVHFCYEAMLLYYGLAVLCKAFPDKDIILMGAHVALKPVYTIHH